MSMKDLLLIAQAQLRYRREGKNGFARRMRELGWDEFYQTVKTKPNSSYVPIQIQLTPTLTEMLYRLVRSGKFEAEQSANDLMSALLVDYFERIIGELEQDDKHDEENNRSIDASINDDLSTQGLVREVLPDSNGGIATNGE